jgi:hypothetical protein
MRFGSPIGTVGMIQVRDIHVLHAGNPPRISVFLTAGIIRGSFSGALQIRGDPPGLYRAPVCLVFPG